MTLGFTRLLDAFLGRGESAITVPALDGALRPNRKLDEAAERIPVESPSGIAAESGGLLIATGNSVRRLNPDRSWTDIHQAEAKISCIAAIGGGVAIGLETGAVNIVGGRFDGTRIEASADARCPVAIDSAENNLYVCHGSATNGPNAWQRDLMERNASGSVWLHELGTSQRHRIAGELAFPAGVSVARERLLIAESWKHRILRLDRATGKVLDIPLTDLPGYPGHLTRNSAGGFLLSLFAPRSQLVEFILREPKYRRRMMAEIEPRYWVAPAYRAGRSFYEPLQGGGVKHLGILKPWAPTLSFGMVVRLDENCLPLESFQSRADGITHGIVGAVEMGGHIYAAARGDQLIAKLTIASGRAAP
ncbi:MAG TPA: hypothetical protein VGG27_18960 [Magnetospirillaceae bacterium]|jgi:hypothetical protein